MTTLFLAKENKTLNDFNEIQKYMTMHGVILTRWEANAPLNENSSQEEILAAYAHELNPFMESNGFVDADVINIHPGLGEETLQGIRQKFMKEHTHSEDEIRFFVDGEGKFWFNFENGDVYCLTCTRGDFISVPNNYLHWFDPAPNYFVKAIRIFSNREGWTPHYTNSGVDTEFNP
jgi:1,2-dihydroxy-3-keto-5-methylthiopentene dioxygenase